MPEPSEGLEYRNLGTMEHHVCDGAAKAPKKDGKGYLYPVRGGRPFAGTFMTNRRKAILGLLENKGFNELNYR